MDKPGRNDPCPCGSGRKYKRCCLGHEAEREAYATTLTQSAVPLLSRLVRYVEDVFRRPLDAVARDAFPNWAPPLDEAQAARVIEHLIFEAPLPHVGRPAIDQFILEQSGTLNRVNDDQRQMLDVWAPTRRRLYRVDGWSAGFLHCADAFATEAAPIAVWPLGKPGAPIADGAPVALRALPAAGQHICIGRPSTFGERSVDDVTQAVRSRHHDYVRARRIVAFDEFLRLEPRALDEEAARAKSSSIILPGVR